MVFEAVELDGTASQRAVEEESSVEEEKSAKDKGQSRPEKYTENSGWGMSWGLSEELFPKVGCGLL